MRRSFCMALVLCCSVLSPAQEGDGNWFMAQTKQATVKSVIATSELVEAQFDGKYLYPPINILDGDFQTTWCEAEEDGPGMGESITVEFAEAVSFDEIQIVNGFATKDYYLKNNRVKKLLLTQVAGQHFQQKEYTLRDKKDGWQSISFDLPQTAQTITLKILDIYSGSKYDDTCLADIRLLYKGKVIPFAGVQTLKAIQEENSRILMKDGSQNFRQQFMSLFYGNDTMYLISQRGTGTGIMVEKEGETLRITEGGSAYTVDELRRNNYKIVDYYTITDIPDTAKYVFAFGWSYRSPPQGTLGVGRLLKTEVISYVETTTAIIIKIEGNTIWWNGEPYTVVTEKEVYLEFIPSK